MLFDGTVTDEHEFVAIGGHAEEVATTIKNAYQARWDLPAAVREAVQALSSAEGREIVATQLEGGVLDRTIEDRRKFRRLPEEEIAQILTG